MKKENLQDFVQKYALNGEIQDSIWKIEDGVLNVKFRSESKTVMGEGFLKNANEFDNCTIGINKANTILSSIASMDNDVEIKILKDEEHDRFTYLYFKDKDVEKYCKLSDPELILNTFKGFQGTDDMFDTVIEIDPDFIRKFSKIETVEDAKNVSIKVNEDGTASIVVNYSKNKISDSGKFSFDVKQFKDAWDNYIPFNIDIFKKILKTSKNFILGQLLVSKQYNVAKFKFMYDNEDLEFTYYVPAYETINE